MTAQEQTDNDLLGEGTHTRLGQAVRGTDKNANAARHRIHNHGEDVWYAPGPSEVEVSGRMGRLGPDERNGLAARHPDAVAAVDWVAIDIESGETEIELRVLTEQEYRTIRSEALSTVIADIVAADDRERTGRPKDGESLVDAAERLAELMRARAEAD